MAGERKVTGVIVMVAGVMNRLKMNFHLFADFWRHLCFKI
jgi:hypothetical protein